MVLSHSSVLKVLVLGCFLGACGDAPVPPGRLDVPPVNGPLRPIIVYPLRNAELPAAARHTVFGSVGNGLATLTINGMPVPVLRNGSFLVHLPGPTIRKPWYELVAVLGKDTVRFRHPVRLNRPETRFLRVGSLVVDTSDLLPRGQLWLRPEEQIRVAIRAPADAHAWVEGTGDNYRTLVAEAPDSHLRSRARTARAFPIWAADLPGRALHDRSILVIARGPDTARVDLPPASLVESTAARWGILRRSASTPAQEGQAIAARPIPGGAYQWLLFPGTQLEVTGQRGGFVRVRLDSSLEGWVDANDIDLQGTGVPAPQRIARNPYTIVGEEWVDFAVPLGARPAFSVEEGTRELSLTLYGTQSDTDVLRYPGGDTFLKLITWEQVTGDRLRFRLHLSHAPLGYDVTWTGSQLVLRVRRAPRVNSSAPLRGLRIAIDPGHPPHGAVGPTGLREAEVTLLIAARTRRLLQARGAHVVMTRTADEPVSLERRTTVARRANAHALVSIHVDAVPGSVDPRRAQGTSTHFYHPHSESLARKVQIALLERLGLPNRGISYNNLALVRPTWMPAILCEGATLIIPEQEAALRTPEFQEAYARGIVDGLENYFRELAENE